MPPPDSAAAFLAALIARARPLHKRIVFPEGHDARVIEAAERLARDNIVQPILIRNRPSNALPDVTFVDPVTCDRVRDYAALLYERRKASGVTHAEAQELARQPLYFAALMVAAGDAVVVGRSRQVGLPRAQRDSKRLFQPDRGRERERPPAGQRLFQRRDADLGLVSQPLPRDPPARDLLANQRCDRATLGVGQL